MVDNGATVNETAARAAGNETENPGVERDMECDDSTTSREEQEASRNKIESVEAEVCGIYLYEGRRS
jgi:hypothetical protein